MAKRRRHGDEGFLREVIRAKQPISIYILRKETGISWCGLYNALDRMFDVYEDDNGGLWLNEGEESDYERHGR